jgi:glucosylceramidase
MLLLPRASCAVALFILLGPLLGHAEAPATAPHVLRYLTARDLDARLKEVPIDAHLISAHRDDTVTIRVEPRVTYQEIIGFGGAFTDAAGSVLQKMPAAKQEEILRAYFDPAKGLGYTLCRTHINSCDFSTENYAYDDTPGDVELKNFSIERDRRDLIPMIKRAQKISHNGFKLFASPWSPPAWMKTNGDMNNGGKLKPEYRDAWARYFVRYIQEYAKEQIPIWGVTVQNEPAATQTWDSCIYTGEEERDFVRDDLGPEFAKAGLDTKIMVWDHNRDLMYEFVRPILDDPVAAKYVWGVAFHWYGPEVFSNIQSVHDAWPDKPLMMTEGCQEGGPHLNEWAVGERYGHAMIEDLNHWSAGWVDWNILLDEKGGPNHVGNLCGAPIIADTATGDVSYQPSYYFIGQFAKFIHPGAKRVLTAMTTDKLDVTAFVNPDGSTVAVVMNPTEVPMRIDLKLGTQDSFTDAPQRSIQTVIVSP